MDKKELALILKEGEGYFMEFKQSFSGVEKDFVAFANSSGGRVLLGVTDEGEQVMDFVQLYAKVAYRITGRPQRENIYEYSFEAIREAVINSVMHKDYFEHGHNNILKFFPDRIQLENI